MKFIPFSGKLQSPFGDELHKFQVVFFPQKGTAIFALKGLNQLDEKTFFYFGTELFHRKGDKTPPVSKSKIDVSFCCQPFEFTF